DVKMGEILGDVLLPLLPGYRIITDDVIFRLHYQTTTSILVACLTIIIGTRSLDDAFTCFKEDDSRDRTIEKFCYAQNTYIALKNVSDAGCNRVYHMTPVTVHSYHDWLVIVLCIEVFLFWTPRYIWKSLESGRMENLISNFRLPNFDKNLWKRKTVNYFTSVRNQPPSLYVYAYIYCEILNLANVLLQMFLMDHFLGAVFTTHGLDILSVITTPREDRVDAMASAFPTHGLWKFRDLGYWMCHLRFNYVSEKTLVLLWFWYTFLASVSTINLILQAAVLLSRRIRALHLQHLMFNSSPTEARVIAHSFNLSDWFMLCLIGENVRSIIFQELVEDIYRQI
ncbi:Structural component of gap junctions protein, partial [Homalodisca vitripennis]